MERNAGRGRIVDNHVTAAGHQALAAVTPQAEAVIAAALAALGPSDRADFQRLLAEFADALTRPQPDDRTDTDQEPDGR